MATFDIKDTASLRKHIDKRMEKAARRGLLSAANRTVGLIKGTIIPSEPRPPVDMGIYTAAWKAQPLPGAAAEVYNDAPHAPIIEHGARAGNIKIGRKMLEALARWVKRKGLITNFKYVPTKGTRAVTLVRKVKRTKVETDTAAMRAAWAIAKSMKKRGIFNDGKGLGILKKAMRFAKLYVVEEVAAEIASEFE